ncbi:hypothetical protein CLU96_4663 [Chryseobacterium sp. 52]|uniref:hypothetical protein n=1 Tax=Chryseobacterium sp. 52 TaxID=2035213 RepID=UPI000C176384|nr:hypothetical protein [Chryseobacterium sp. 52]PIF47596.1 hypothetical protein CLU96_4663 [Chryseobacterium sp. 52]
MNTRRLYGQFIKFTNDSILEYNSLVENNIKDAISKIESDYEEFTKNNPGIDDVKDDDYADYYSNVVDELAYKSQKLSGDILQYHRKGILIQFYSVLEKELHKISQIIGEDSPFKMTELKGNSAFDQFKIYIKKIEPSLHTVIQNDLTYFDKIKAVRNIITHNDSVLRKDHPNYNKINDFSRDRYKMNSLGNDVLGTEIFRIELDNPDFLKEIFTKFEEFTDKVYQ